MNPGVEWLRELPKEVVGVDNHVLDEVGVDQYWMVVYLQTIRSLKFGIEHLLQDQGTAPYDKGGVLGDDVVVGPDSKRDPFQDPTRQLRGRVATCSRVRSLGAKNGRVPLFYRSIA